MSSPFTTHQLSLNSQFTSLGFPWSPTWETILRLDPTYFADYLRLRLVPLERQHLDPKIQELLLLAIDASVTHLFRPGIRAHIAAALEVGATPAEVLEVLEADECVGGARLECMVPAVGGGVAGGGVIEGDSWWRDG
jgi:Carboxymuconolactone decarboxylase family